MYMHYLDGDDEKDQQPTNDHIAGPEAGDYQLPDDIGTRIGESDAVDNSQLG